MAKNKLDLRPLIKAFAKEKRNLPKQLGNDAVNFFQENFNRVGFLDRTVSPWEKRKPSTERIYRKKGINFDVSKPLTNSGNLRRSIKRISTSFSRIKIGTRGVEYANIHNKGLTGLAWGKHSFKMPKRQFIGKSFVLEKALKKRIEKEFRNFTRKLS